MKSIFYAARDISGTVCLYDIRPVLGTNGVWSLPAGKEDRNGIILTADGLSTDIFNLVTYQNSPVKITVTIDK